VAGDVERIFDDGGLVDTPAQRDRRLRELVLSWENYCSVGDPVSAAFALTEFANAMTHLGWQLEEEAAVRSDGAQAVAVVGVKGVGWSDFRVCWSAEDGEFVATVNDFPSLSWVASDPVEALRGLVAVLQEQLSDL
jgi:hypothetical protein